MKPQEARTRVCPVMQSKQIQQEGSVWIEYESCHADGCMLWTWIGMDHLRMTLRRKAKEHVTGEPIIYEYETVEEYFERQPLLDWPRDNWKEVLTQPQIRKRFLTPVERDGECGLSVAPELFCSN